MKNKKCIHTTKKDCDAPITFIILCSQKSNKRGYKNIPLTPIHNSLLIDIQISTIISNYPKAEIILVSGFEHDRLVAHIHSHKYHNIRIAENKNYKMSSALECWIFALNIAAKENTYIIHGDRLFSSSCIAQANQQNTHTISHKVDKNNYDLGLLIEKNRLLNISYGLPNVWSEIFFISKKDFDLARNIINDYNKQKLYSLESFINILSNHIHIPVLQKDISDIKILKEL